MAKNEYSAEALKERGHSVIEKERWKDFDEMVDNNCQSWYGLNYVKGVIDLCEIMHNESLSLEQRRRKAYDKFQEQDHNGCSAHMTMDALRHLCTDGNTLADEIADFKYDPSGSLSERRERKKLMKPYLERQMKIQENIKDYLHFRDAKILSPDTKEVTDIVPVYCTQGGMLLIEYPYRYSAEECLKITQYIGRRLGMCYGIFNNVPMFSFDTYDTFFRRQHNGLTQEDYAEFRDALCGDHYDGEKAERILRERTWPHLGKRY